MRPTLAIDTSIRFLCREKVQSSRIQHVSGHMRARASACARPGLCLTVSKSGLNAAVGSQSNMTLLATHSELKVCEFCGRAGFGGIMVDVDQQSAAHSRSLTDRNQCSRAFTACI